MERLERVRGHSPVITTKSRRTRSAQRSRVADSEQIILQRLNNFAIYSVSQSDILFGITPNIESGDLSGMMGILLRHYNLRYKDHKYDTMEYLMTKASPFDVASIVSLIGFSKLRDQIDVFYNLLWHLYTTSYDDIGFNFKSYEISYISGLTSEQLLEALPDNYFSNNYPRDKASLLYTAVARHYRQPINIPQDRYIEVSKYPPAAVWKLAKSYGILSQEQLSFLVLGLTIGELGPLRGSRYTPYELVALQPKGTIEEIVTTVNLNNINELINRYGIVLPNRKNMVNDFIDQILDYKSLFLRSPDLPYPLNLSQYTRKETEQALASYTTKELAYAYEPVDRWKNRTYLIRIIILEREYQDIPQWTWYHYHCKNDNTWNNAQYERHGDVNKDDPNDPTLSYGLKRNYRCFQVTELTNIFTEYNDFQNPDYDRNNTGIDPTTHEPYSQYFSRQSIKELRDLLTEDDEEEAETENANIKSLLTVIKRILVEQKDNRIILSRLKEEYDTFNVNQQHIAELFIAWLFIYGMWMRFWKGPGNPWPYNPSRDNICIPTSRHQHVEIQNYVFRSLSSVYSQDAQVKKWVERLPIASHNFQDDTGKVKRETVISLMPGYLAGTHCMGIGGDLFVQTAYVLITDLLGFNQKGQIDEFLSEMLPELLQVEKDVVNTLLSPNATLYFYIQLMNHGEDIDAQLRDEILVVMERQDELNNPNLQYIDEFIPHLIKPNKHLD